MGKLNLNTTKVLIFISQEIFTFAMHLSDNNLKIWIHKRNEMNWLKNKQKQDKILQSLNIKTTFLFFLILVFSHFANAQVTLESQVKITDIGLYFDGEDLDFGNVDDPDTGQAYDFFFGRSISAHGDAVKTYKHYVFMTWYKGGKDERQVMLTRLNTLTGTTVDIEFPHRHTGFRGNPLVGESHNTIGLAVSPINGTIHMVYDMHAYNNTNHGGVFRNDFFRYSFSVEGAADLPDDEFTLAQFVKDVSEISQGDDDYKHLTMTGDIADQSNFASLTYPKFFRTDDGTLLLYMRLGGNNNGAYVFNRYNAATNSWSTFTKFNENNQRSAGNPYNWGLYGNMKYLNGKLRVGFQQRSSDNDDKFKYQNGVYYAYSDNPEGFGDWFNHKGVPMTWPLINSDEIKVFEPGDYITHDQPNSVYIVKDFDWTVTAQGDIHIISLVQTNTSSADAQENGFADIPRERVYIHSYKPAGAEEFIIDTDFVGATSIYTSGNNVYIIGLNNGKPYVEVAAGGTSTFTRVYEQTDGPVFAHGTIYIDKGKVYYYLMERGSGNALPLYLQIIDLDIPKVNANFNNSNMQLVAGYSELNITLTAATNDVDRSIQNIALYIDDNLISVLDSPPYNWNQTETQLNRLPIGTYLISAVVTDDLGQESESNMTISVIDGAPTISFSKLNFTLLLGNDDLEITLDVATPDLSRTLSIISLNVNGNLISSFSAPPYIWTSEQSSLESLTEGTYDLTATAVDSTGIEIEASALLTVLDPKPIGNFSEEVYTVTEGYEQLSINVTASSPVDSRLIAGVELYVNDTLIRTESVAPYEWGHNEQFSDELLNFPAGLHTLIAKLIDNEGIYREVEAVLVVQEEIVPPVVSFSELPQPIQEGYTQLTIKVDANSPMQSRSISNVVLYLNDVQVSQLSNGEYQWTEVQTSLASLTAGTYQIRAVATDSSGLQTEASGQIVITARPSTTTPSTTTSTQADTSSGSSGGTTSPLIIIALCMLLCARKSR